MHIESFDWTEYSMFCAMLTLSSFIGIYFGFIKGGSKTLSEYLLGGKQMPLIPVVMSLISSYISGVTLLGIPTEIYNYGIQYMLMNVSLIISGILNIFFVLPVFYKLQFISTFEYLEVRFSSKVRKITSLVYTIFIITYIPIVIYGPALAINQVSGISIHAVSTIMSTVCIFYTTLGGLKAVVWTDLIQSVVMIGMMLTVICLGTIRIGGPGVVFQYAKEGERLDLINMDINPTARLTFWSTIIGTTILSFSQIAFAPAFVQRYISLPTYGRAKISVVCMVVGIVAFVSSSGYNGLILYSEFKDCDPLSSRIIQRPDQILPYFVFLIVRNIKGLTGLFISGIVSAALSSMSTNLNTIAGTFYKDIIEPLLKCELSEKTASLVIKLMVVVFGAICILMVAIIDKFGAITEINASFAGVTDGTMLGVFLLGLFFPWANNKGALSGMVVSMGLMICILVGSTIARFQGFLHYTTKPMSIDNCSIETNSTILPFNEDLNNNVFALFRVSPFFYPIIACFLVITIGLSVSFLTGPNDLKKINKDLICPATHWVLPKIASYNAVPLNDLKESNVNRKHYVLPADPLNPHKRLPSSALLSPLYNSQSLCNSRT